MKVYYYTDKEAGVHWPGPDADFLLPDGRKKYDVPHPRFVWYELPSFERTDDASQANVFVLRQRLIWLTTQQVYGLPYLKGNEHKHVFFDLGSDGDMACFRDFGDIQAIFLRAVCDKPMLAKNPTTVTWPWPVDDFGAYADRPFEYDAVFQGQIVQGGEKTLLDSVSAAGLKVHRKVNKSFYGTMPWGTPEKQALRNEFAETMARARLSLCHRSNSRGVMRYRFYEAMSMARVPVLLGDDCILPFADKIDYNKCSLRLSESDAVNAGAILSEWLGKHTDNDILAMGQYGQAMWRRWLDRTRWAKVVDGIVRERL